jgi:hypothetical protein
MFNDAQDDVSDDPRLARAEERRRMLRELAELGMELTRALVRQAAAPLQDPQPSEDDGGPRSAPRRDPADAFGRLSRAVRLTLALEARLDDDRAARRAGKASPPAETFDASGVPPPLPSATPTDLDPVAAYKAHREAYLNDFAPEGVELTYHNCRPLPWDYPSAFRNEVRDAVVEVINHEIHDYYRAPRVLDDLYERLWEGERYDAFINRPLDEVVAAICADLGIEVDRSLWKPDREVTENGVTTTYRGHRDWTGSWKPMGSMLPKRRLYRHGQENPPPDGASP